MERSYTPSKSFFSSRSSFSFPFAPEGRTGGNNEDHDTYGGDHDGRRSDTWPDNGRETKRSVTVCLYGDVVARAVPSAEASASRMFAGIGLAITWHDGRRDCSAREIRVDLRRDAPASLNRGALAFARPYEGTEIQVFYNRISENREPRMVSVILAHVLVHEITHIIEGIDRHSSYGIMKAQWDTQDHFRMRFKPLEFAPEDIDLIYRGLASRSRVPMLMASAQQMHQ